MNSGQNKGPNKGEINSENSGENGIKTLAFNVFLGANKTPIGQHFFIIKPRKSGGYSVDSRCKFDVNIFFFNAYSYNHQTKEIWQDGCLKSLESQTVENSKTMNVTGDQEDGQFIWQKADGTEKKTADCVRSFAYWKPAYLSGAKKLLNPQTGELTDVTTAIKDVHGDQTPLKTSGKKLSISADELDIQVWYNQAMVWRALTSKIDGNKIFYERTKFTENTYEDLLED